MTTFEQQLQTTSKDHALSKQLIPAIVKAAGKLSRAVADSAALQKKLDALHRQRTAMIEKLDAIIIPRLSLKDAELADVIKFLSRRAKELDPRAERREHYLAAGEYYSSHGQHRAGEYPA